MFARKKLFHYFSEVPHFFQEATVSIKGLFGKVSIHLQLERLFKQVQLIPFILLTFFKEAKALDLFAEDSNHTQYKLTYDPEKFPNIKQDLIDSCQMVLFDAEQCLYEFVAYVQCKSEEGIIVPMVNISEEFNKTLNLDCMNLFLQTECDNYFNQDSIDDDWTTTDKIALGVIFGVLILASVIGSACILYRNRKSDDKADSSYKRLEDKPKSRAPSPVLWQNPVPDVPQHHHHDTSATVEWHASDSSFHHH